MEDSVSIMCNRQQINVDSVNKRISDSIGAVLLRVYIIIIFEQGLLPKHHR